MTAVDTPAVKTTDKTTVKTAVETPTDQVVKIQFCYATYFMFNLNVNTSQTVDQLIQQVKAEWKVFIFFLFS